MTNTSVTLEETGIADTINKGGPYDSAPKRTLALDFESQAQDMKQIAGQTDFALGSVHAVPAMGRWFSARPPRASLPRMPGAGPT